MVLQKNAENQLGFEITNEEVYENASNPLDDFNTVEGIIKGENSKGRARV